MVLAAYPCSILLKLLETECASYGASAFARRARAYGQPSWRVFSQEIVPIAIIAPLAGFANTLAFFVTGTFFVEAVFNIPGVGGLSYEAIRNKDLPVLLAVCLLYAIAVSLISVALEGGLRIADPRIGSGRGD
jgi:peptide/nickel transport system permease protein